MAHTLATIRQVHHPKWKRTLKQRKFRGVNSVQPTEAQFPVEAQKWK